MDIDTKIDEPLSYTTEKDWHAYLLDGAYKVELYPCLFYSCTLFQESNLNLMVLALSPQCGRLLQ